MHLPRSIALILALTAVHAAAAGAQQQGRSGVAPAPARGADEGEGPF